MERDRLGLDIKLKTKFSGLENGKLAEPYQITKTKMNKSL